MSIQQARPAQAAPLAIPRAAVAYLRVSSDKQPLSIGDQRGSIARWAGAHGVSILREYVDDAISGASAEGRAAFQAMVTDLETRRDVQHVLVYDVSRFGRTDTDEAGFYRFRLRKAGAEVVYVAETAVTGGDADDLLLPVLQYQKREYLRSLSRDTIRGLVSRAKRGAWCGGPVPFGYARELRAPDGRPGRRLAPADHANTEDGSAVFLVPGDPAQIEAVRMAFDLHYTQGKGLDAVRDAIVNMGVAPPRSHVWRTSTVRAILRNAVYIGRATYGVRTDGKFHRVGADGAVARTRAEAGRFAWDKSAAAPIVVEGAHPVLVSADAVAAFRAAEAADLERRRSNVGQRRMNQFSHRGKFVLTGLVRCTHCGFNFCGLTRRKAAYEWREYVCVGYTGSGTHVCSRFPLPGAPTEEWVAETVAEEWKVEDDFDTVAALALQELEKGSASATPESASQLRKAIAKLDAQAVAMLRAADASHADIMNAAIAEIKRERTGLEARLRDVEETLEKGSRFTAEAERVASIVRSFPRVWQEATPEERKLILPGFVRRVVADPDRERIGVELWRVPKVSAITRSGQEKCARPGRPGRAHSSMVLVAGVHFGSYTPNAPTPVQLSSRPAHPHVRFKITIR